MRSRSGPGSISVLPELVPATAKRPAPEASVCGNVDELPGAKDQMAPPSVLRRVTNGLDWVAMAMTPPSGVEVSACSDPSATTRAQRKPPPASSLTMKPPLYEPSQRRATPGPGSRSTEPESPPT